MRTGGGGGFSGWGSYVRFHRVCWMLFSVHFFLSSPITNTRESKGTNTGGYRHIIRYKEFPYSGYYLLLSASQINM